MSKRKNNKPQVKQEFKASSKSPALNDMQAQNKMSDQLQSYVMGINNNGCGTDECGDNHKIVSQWDSQERDGFDRYEYLDNHLSSLRSTVVSLVSLIMSQRLLSGGTENDQLNKFLYSMNIQQQTNYETLIEGITHALIYGRAGFRWLSEKDGLIFVPSNEYTIVYAENQKYLGFEEVLGYVVARPQYIKSYGAKMDVTGLKFGVDYERDIGVALGSDQDNYIYLKPDSFYNLYFYGDAIDADSPLDHDLDRIEMFLNLITSLAGALDIANNDVQIIKLQEDLLSMSNMQASDLVATSKNAKETRFDVIKKEVGKFAEQVASFTGLNTLVLPKQASEINKLSSDITVSDFLNLYEYIESFISKLYGLSSNVLTLENMPRDASANPIFEQMMKTSVYPKRTFVEIMFNQFIGKKLGIQDIKFATESYAQGTVITNAQSLANVISTLHSAEVPVNLPDGVIDDIIKKATN